MPAARNDVAPEPVLYGSCPAPPPAIFVADVALPLNEAVIVPAEKFPEASLCTTYEAVFVELELIPIVPVDVIVPPVIGDDVAMDVTVPLPVPAPIEVLNVDADSAVIVLSALTFKNVTAEGFVSVNKLLPTVVPPRLVLPVAATKFVEPPSH